MHIRIFFCCVYLFLILKLTSGRKYYTQTNMSFATQDIKNIVEEEMKKMMPTIIQQIKDKITGSKRESINIYVDGHCMMILPIKPACLKKNVYLESQLYLDEKLFEMVNSMEISKDDLYEYIDSDPSTSVDKLILFYKLRDFEETGEMFEEEEFDLAIKKYIPCIHGFLRNTLLENWGYADPRIDDELILLGNKHRTCEFDRLYNILDNEFVEYNWLRVTLSYLEGDEYQSALYKYNAYTSRVIESYKNAKDELLRLLPDLAAMYDKVGNIIR